VKINALFEKTNSVGTTGLNELIKTGIIEKISKEDRLSKENKLVQDIFLEMSKNSGMAVYGIEKVKKAIQSNAARQIILTDELLLEKRKETEEILEQAEQTAAKIHIISIQHEAGKNLASLEGIACLLRFTITK
jgi:protein pelota